MNNSKVKQPTIKPQHGEVKMLNFIDVSFFSGLSVQTKTQRCRFPKLPKSALTGLIAGAMQTNEFFACYRDQDVVVIALDKNGFCVTE